MYFFSLSAAILSLTTKSDSAILLPLLPTHFITTADVSKLLFMNSTSLIFNKMNIYRVDLLAAKERIAKLESDLKLITELVLEYKRIAKL